MKKDTFVMRYKPSVICLYLEGLPKFYIGYKQVSGNYLIDSLSASGNINKKGRHLSQYRA